MNSLWQTLATLLSVCLTFLILFGTTEGNETIDGRILKILESEYPELFSPDFDMVKRYSAYAFGLGKRKPNFSFGIGKRQELTRMENTIREYEDHHRRKRSSVEHTKPIDHYERDQAPVEVKRSSYGFGIGKRYNEDFPEDLYQITRQNFMNDLVNDYFLSHFPYYNYRALPELSGYENTEGKRAKTPYSFGLGKRGYSFGLGKRDGYSFGLGKRQVDMLDFNGDDDRNVDSINKRKSNYHFGLGKRSYDFGLGKKNSDSM